MAVVMATTTGVGGSWFSFWRTGCPNFQEGIAMKWGGILLLYSEGLEIRRLCSRKMADAQRVAA